MSSKTAAIVQSNYIPWKGYFDLIAQVDDFVLYDDVQYTRRDWRNRNKIQTAGGLVWLTIPVEVSGKYTQSIRETKVSDRTWNQKHWRSFEHHYAKAPHFKQYREFFAALYASATDAYLSEVNHRFMVAICGLLGIETRIRWSMEFELEEGRSERLAGICRQLGATRYISGPSAQAYMEPAVFERQGIAVEYADYSGYPEYRQLHPPFEHGVTILDLIFNEGPRARSFMKCGMAQPSSSKRAEPASEVRP